MAKKLDKTDSMRKPTKAERDDIVAKSTDLVSALSTQGFGSPAVDVHSEDDRMISCMVDDPIIPGKRIGVVTPFVTTPHPQTQAVDTAEDFITSGRMKKRVQDMVIRRAAEAALAAEDDAAKSKRDALIAHILGK